MHRYRGLMVRVVATLTILLGMAGSVTFVATAQEGPAPTVGEIVVDSFDCTTGRLSFHVPVTDLPHVPDSNGPLGASVTGTYASGTSGLPGIGFNPEAADAPYSGDVPLSTIVPLSGEDSMSPENASGPLQSIDISISVGYGTGDGPVDTSSVTYSVDCAGTTPGDGATDPAPDADSDGTLIPVCVQGFEDTPGVAYLTQAQIDEIEATWAAYDQSDIPPPQITGYPDPATGSCATENGVPIDYDPDIYSLICVPSGVTGDGPLVPQLGINHYLEGAEGVIYADSDTGACSEESAAGDPPTATDSDASAETGSGDEAVGDDEESGATDDSESDAPGTNTDGDDVSALPSTGAGAVADSPSVTILGTLLAAVAVLLTLAAVRVRHRM